MRITVNGNDEEILQTHLAAYLNQKKICTDGLVVEHNRNIIPSNQWADIILADGDTLELLNFVGGG